MRLRAMAQVAAKKELDFKGKDENIVTGRITSDKLQEART